MQTTAALTWQKRRTREPDPAALDRLVRYSTCRLFRVVFVRPLGGLSPRFYAEAFDGHRWRMISHHRKPGPAQAACEAAAAAD